MFPQRYFPDRMYAPRFWPKVGSASAPFIGPTAFASIGAQRGVGTTGTGEQRGQGITGTGTIRGVGVDRSEGKPR